MTEPLDTTAIRARAEAATKGPWRAIPNLGGVPNGVDLSLDPCVMAVVHSDAEPPNLAADTEFIAHARTDVPALCDALDEARRMNALLHEECDIQERRAEAAEAERDRLAAQIERVRALSDWFDAQPNWREWRIGSQIRGALDAPAEDQP